MAENGRQRIIVVQAGTRVCRSGESERARTPRASAAVEEPIVAPWPAAREKKTPAARSGRESQSRRCHTNYGFRLRKSRVMDNESISISI
ncbi:hypothetical protein GWK53_19475 [Burkholderia cepacia]|uniref:hypothetical protein n=1 Tax=Burkholderia cepacia TaxID=292 RepID=UPI0013F4B21A|nr:hypothetical protein [Burkholderia cepacia]NHB08687.1 hypothetical protein [Burkholderia cepacia]